jgi:hypothetical protein
MKKKTSAKKRIVKAVRPSDPRDQALRDHLLYLLRGGGAHVTFDDAIGAWPVRLAGAMIANFPHSAWMLLEHMRLAQWDILEFSRNPKHVSGKWPEEYWPASEAPATEKSLESEHRRIQERSKSNAAVSGRPARRSLRQNSVG